MTPQELTERSEQSERSAARGEWAAEWHTPSRPALPDGPAARPPRLPGEWLRPPFRSGLPIRARLALSYAGMVTGSVAVFILIVYLFMRYVPAFQLTEAFGGATPFERVDPGAGGAVEIRSADDFLDTFLLVSGIALAALALLGAAVGWIVAGRIIKPLAAINLAATRAATGNLDHRVGLEGPRDEVSDLADTFDRMLASLERSFASHRRFAANASHELRTPLATTQTMIDVALDDPETDAAEFRALAGRVREMNRANIETVNALLDLCDAEGGVRVREPVELSALARSVIERHRAEAEAAGVELRRAEGRSVWALGDPVLIRQALSNLVRNALRHNHRGGHAEVRPSTEHGAARLTVVNTGPVVAPERVPSLVEPFVRGDGRVKRRGAGHGLGLALVTAVATAHDGTLRLGAPREGGLAVRLDLPLADPPF
ncbi:two-component system, OmpR family, sensor histidine kinase VanS [Streptomyces zhaozhouensis]|uniref:histidine kinase n=1 Tax=Streptomyces zhaozhouensis TaxID=1300267 RepID=A0A286DT35_9ACTN|nr:HAMP domain-containing sensor histidine kinase [Streptomyces zhaozhouensis]SOD61836.1 two-component system, OmpR family, sensor histidine kinase VanS [Streptomyces zhaozhouensis]